MRAPILITIVALPLMAFGQKEDQSQPQAQGQTKDTEATAPATAEKQAPAQPAAKSPTKKSESAAGERSQTDVKGRAREGNKAEGETRASDERGKTDIKSNAREVNKTDARSSSGKSRTKVSVSEFKSRHSEVFSLGRHPKEFFIQKYGANHFRLIGNTYFVFLDGCWVAVDVDGFTYTQRVICEGDPDFIQIVD